MGRVEVHAMVGRGGLQSLFDYLSDFSDNLPFFSGVLGGNVHFLWFVAVACLFHVGACKLQLSDSIVFVYSCICCYLII